MQANVTFRRVRVVVRARKQWQANIILATLLVIYDVNDVRMCTRENNMAYWWQMARPWFNIYAIVMMRSRFSDIKTEWPLLLRNEWPD